MVARSNLRLIRNRLYSIGTVDDFVVLRDGGPEGAVKRVFRFKDIREFEVVSRWPPRMRQWMTAIAFVGFACSSIGILWFAMDPQQMVLPWIACPLVLGLLLLWMAHGMDPQWCVVIHTADERVKVAVFIVSESDLRKRIVDLNRVISERTEEETVPDEDADVLAADDKATAGAQNSGSSAGAKCAQCGYDLRGPPLIIEKSSTIAQFFGMILILLGGTVLLCVGGSLVDYSFRASDALPCGITLIVGAIPIVSGVLLFRVRCKRIPFKDPGQCSACGWQVPVPAAPPTCPTGQVK